MAIVWEWAKDNDEDVFIENLPTGLSLECFVAATNTQSATAVHANLSPSVVWGTYDIKALYDANGVEVSPARPGVTCYRAQFSGAYLTAHGIFTEKCFVILRQGQHVRVFAELYIRENKTAKPRPA